MIRTIGTTTREQMEHEWASIVRESIQQGVIGRPAGEGWKTVAEFAQDARISRPHAHTVLCDKLRQAKVELQRGKIDGHWVHFYRPKRR